MRTPKENLFRLFDIAAVELRANVEAGPAPTMFGHFAVFDTWTEIHSYVEGDFMERIAPGAFKRTINDPQDRTRLRATHDHGYSRWGDEPIGPIDLLREDGKGAYYEVPLLDSAMNHDYTLPLLEGRLMNGEKRGPAGLVGASFKFRVTDDSWNDTPKRSTANPQGLPERTIREVRLLEFGSVIYPAYAEASAGVRSLTDHYFEAELQRSGRLNRAAARIQSLLGQQDTGHVEDAPAEDPDDTADSRSRVETIHALISERHPLAAHFITKE
jgi:HK97 family phage prohead protease